MPQFRKHPITHEWVVIATERGKRPSDFKKDDAAPKPQFNEKCPFCPGNEAQTPPEVFAFREEGTAPDTAGWSTRVVSNKFPAVQIEGNLDKQGFGLYDWMNGVGAHEVVVESPRHDLQIGFIELHLAVQVWKAVQGRMIDLDRDERFKYVQVFRNHGKIAGASLEHPHCQIIALPIIPGDVKREIEGFRRYYQLHDRCLLEDMIAQERQQQVRVIEESPLFIAFCPFAPKSPFETWIVPKRHNASFTEISQEDIEDFSNLVQRSLRRISNLLGDPPYNYVLRSAPYNMEGDPEYRWRLEIIPRLTIAAGFELGSGVYINPTPPEDAAEHLREAVADAIVEEPQKAGVH